MSLPLPRSATGVAGTLRATVDTTGPGAVLVRVHGEVDTVSTPELQQVLLRAERTAVSSLVVDLGGVTFLNVSALAVLFAARDRARAAGAAFTVERVPRAIARFLENEELELSAA